MRLWTVVFLVTMLVAGVCVAQDPNNSAWSANPAGVARIYFPDDPDGTVESHPAGTLSIKYLLPFSEDAAHNLSIAGGGGGGTGGGIVETLVGYAYSPVDINPSVIMSLNWTFALTFPSETLASKYSDGNSETWINMGATFMLDFKTPGVDLPTSLILGWTKGFRGKPDQVVAGIAIPMSPKPPEETLRSKYPANYKSE